MKHGLLIAEKSSARNDIEAIYNKNRQDVPYKLDFEQFHGHVVELKMPGEIRPEWEEWEKEELPMIPKDDEWAYIPEQDPTRYNAVKRAIESGKYDFIINAGDYEREGQLIQDAFFSTLDTDIPIYRLWGNDLTEKEVLRGLNDLLKPEDTIPSMGSVQHLSDASFLRARMDWLIGLNSTRALTLKGGTTIRSGRVKLPILKILADREVGIKEFIVKPFWTVRAQFTQEGDVQYEGILIDDEGKNRQFFDKKDAEQLTYGPKATVNSVKRRESRELPPPLYSIGTLQGEAAELYGISMADTLATVQSLYEAKIVSYPRTDSSHITTEEVAKFIEGLENVASIPELADIPRPNQQAIDAFSKSRRYVDNKKVQGHSALTILPGTRINYEALDETKQRILYLIGRSMLLAFMDPVVKSRTEVLTSSNDLIFKTTGSILEDPGWSEYVPEYGSKNTTLPDIKEGEATVKEQELREGKTTPPRRYTVKSLMSVLENIHRLIEDDEEKEAIKEAEGLGRPSTRTSILDEMVKDEYIFTKGRRGEYHVTDYGVSIIKNIGHMKLASPELSAHYETLLQHVELGKEPFESVYEEIVKYTQDMVQEILDTDIQLEGAPQKGRKVVYEGEGDYLVFESKAGYYDDAFRQWLDDGQEGERRGLWVPKKIKTDKVEIKGTITQKNLVNLIEGGEVKKKISYHKEPAVDQLITLVDGQLKFESPNKAQDVEVEEFRLQGQLIKLVTGVKDDREFAFYRLEDGRTVFEDFYGYKINKEDLDQLIQGESIERMIYSRKNEKEYPAILTLGEKKVELSFPEREVNYVIDQPGLKVELIEGENKKGKYSFYKVNNQFIVGTTVAGVEVTQDILEALTKDGFYSNDWTSRKGQPFSATLTVQGDRANFVFESDYWIDEPGFQVELIEGENKKGKYSFYKVNNQFTIGTTFAGKDITEDDLRILNQTGRLFASDWISKKGNQFSANLVVQGDKVSFDFS